MMNNLGIYLHIPFCKSKCAYCDFYSLCDYDLAKKYVEQLENQMRAWEDHARNAVCDTVYIGGGTPTSIGKELLLSVISSVKSHFHLSDDHKIYYAPEMKGLSAYGCFLYNNDYLTGSNYTSIASGSLMSLSNSSPSILSFSKRMREIELSLLILSFNTDFTLS